MEASRTEDQRTGAIWWRLSQGGRRGGEQWEVVEGERGGLHAERAGWDQLWAMGRGEARGAPSVAGRRESISPWLTVIQHAAVQQHLLSRWKCSICTVQYYRL